MASSWNEHSWSYGTFKDVEDDEEAKKKGRAPKCTIRLYIHLW